MSDKKNEITGAGLYTPEQKLRRDQTVWTLVQGVLERIDGGQEDLGSEEAYEEAVRRAFPLPGAEAAPKRVKR